ncbi:MAG: YhbY family RNA-binding protein [Oxalobacter sp.]|nr:MAG: YhbY family RNA-binding protein [Oxalobacter sp.]
MLKLSPAQRSTLRSEAHALDPVVIIGENGLTPAVMKEIGLSLDAHGLIKIRVFGDDRDARIAINETICETLNAAPIQHIGKLLVIYRPKVEKPKERPPSKGKGLRKVTVVKETAGGTRRPTVSKVTLQGNQRITQAGSVKRAKKRQTSIKKSALN